MSGPLSGAGAKKYAFQGVAELRFKNARHNQLPEYILGAALLSILVSLVLFYLIDLRNILGVGSLLNRHFFWHWWRNGGPIEWLQWGCLAAAALLGAFIAGRVYNHDKRACAFWALMALAFALMLIEDAGDPRHRIREYVQFVFKEDGQGIMGTLTELFYFAALASVPIYALVRHGRVLTRLVRTKVYVAIGFAAYALAASLSFAGSAFSALLDRNFYRISGELLFRLSLRLGDADLSHFWLGESPDQIQHHIFFQLMDGLVEESIELMGAAAFLAAGVSYLLFLFTGRKQVAGLDG